MSRVSRSKKSCPLKNESWIFNQCITSLRQAIVFHRQSSYWRPRHHQHGLRRNIFCCTSWNSPEITSSVIFSSDYKEIIVNLISSIFRIKMSGGFQMPSAPGYQPAPYPPMEQQGYNPAPYPPMEQQGYQPAPYPPVEQQPGSHMMQPIMSQVCWSVDDKYSIQNVQPMDASGAQFAQPVMGSEGEAWMGPVQEQMVPLNCPPGKIKSGPGGWHHGRV